MKFIKLLLLVLLFNLVLNANETIKIVYNTGTPPLKFTDDNKKANGLLIDIWKLWAKKTNTKVEFIEAPWEETLAMIKDGRADIHAGLYYTKDRDKFLDYTSQILFNNKKYFFYNKSIGKIDKIDDLKPYVISIDNGYPNIFMKNEYPQFSTKSYASANEANRAFFSNDSKVVLSSLSTFFYYLKSHNLNENDYKYSENSFAYAKQYLGAVKQGNKKLLKRINEGFKKFSLREFRFIELKWTKELEIDSLSHLDDDSLFSKEEIAYLDNKKVITMCVDPSWLPFEKINEGKHEGMVSEIISIYEKDLTYPIKLIPTKTWSESLLNAKNRKCDILSAAAATSERKKYMNFSKPYLRFPQVIITREKEPFIEDFQNVVRNKIGIVKNSAIAELLVKKYPSINLVEVNNVADGLFKVSSGELYGFVNTSAAVSYEIVKNGMTDLKIASKVGIDYFLRIAVRNDEPKLLSIINRVITNSDKEAITRIKDKWLSVKVEENIVDYTLASKILISFIVIVFFILYWNRKLHLEIEEKEVAQAKLNKFLQVIEQSQVSIMITNKKGFIEYVNPFCIKETGYSEKEFIGSSPNILKSGVQDKEFYKELWETILTGKTWNGEFSNKKKNGTIFWERAVIAPIFDEKNEINFFVSIKEDITEEIRIKKDLQLAQEQAETANQAKSDFLAKMSHEIRTPMNAVLGMLYLLEKTNLSTIQENYIKKANGAANSLLGVINDILDFSKIEANKLEIKNEEFDIQALLNDTMSVMSLKAEENELELLTYYDKDFPLNIVTDKLRVSQILNNLLSNAIKFTTNGEILVSTKVVTKSNDDVLLLFSVKDSGIGISKENQSKLFQEFSQVDDSATRSFHGTGLGLAISKKLSELLGGEIWLEHSEEGVGTNICFTINAKITDNEMSKSFSFPRAMSNLKVLIVDDNKLAAKVLKEMLDSFEYSVDVVYSGAEAIEKVLKNNYDLVFLDYKMPVLNGLETYLNYKEKLQNKTPKTLLVTAYSQEIVNVSVEEYGIIGYITKPVSPSTLYDTIINSLNFDTCILPKYKAKIDTDELLENQKVLLVEDNILNQEFAVSMLQAFGLQVDVANDGLEGIEKLQTKIYTLVLMDIQMPKLDGLEATRRIRKMEDEYFKNIPIFALSANALQGDKEKSLNAGMNEHITKPIDPNKLFKILKEYINKIKPIELTTELEEFKFIKDIDENILDTKEAMTRVSNNEKAYIKILEQLENNYRNVFDYMEELIKKDDIKVLESKIHELKGIAGNIAAKKLFIVLSDINTLLCNNKMPSKTMFLKCKDELKNLFDEILKIKNDDKKESKAFDKVKVCELLYDIKNNLDEDIVACENANEKLTPFLSQKYSEFSEKLTNALNEFETEKADDLIELFLKEIENV